MRARILALVAPVVGLAILAIPQAQLPARGGGWRSFQTPPVTAAITFSQTFAMTANELSGIEFEAVRVGEPAGNVRIELHELTLGSAPLVREIEIPASDLVASESFLFAFTPVTESAGRTYRLDVGPSAIRPPSGVALVATKGGGYRGGTLLVSDRERWADLAFQVHSPAAASSLARLLDLSEQPNGVWRGYLMLGALMAAWAMLGVALGLLWSRLASPAPFRVAPRPL